MAGIIEIKGVQILKINWKEAVMKQKELKDFLRGINDSGNIIRDYERLAEPSSLLLQRLVNMRYILLEDFAKAATDKPEKRPVKKVVKPEKAEKPPPGEDRHRVSGTATAAPAP